MHHAQTSRRAPRRAGCTAALLALAIALTGCLSGGQADDLNLVNQARRDNRKSILGADSQAMSKAQSWSQHMASTGVLEHTGGGARIDTRGLTNWCGVAENVGSGPSVRSVHDAFLRSSYHRANMLGNYQRIGTGVAARGSQVWVTEIYVLGC